MDTTIKNGQVFSPKEKEVLKWVMLGKGTADVALNMEITPRTVKFHVGNIMEKLAAENRAHAVAIAVEKKLIE